MNTRSNHRDEEYSLALNQARTFIQSHNNHAARKAYKNAIHIDAKKHEAYLEIAYTYEHEDKFHKAIHFYSLALACIKINPFYFSNESSSNSEYSSSSLNTNNWVTELAYQLQNKIIMLQATHNMLETAIKHYEMNIEHRTQSNAIKTDSFNANNNVIRINDDVADNAKSSDDICDTNTDDPNHPSLTGIEDHTEAFSEHTEYSNQDETIGIHHQSQAEIDIRKSLDLAISNYNRKYCTPTSPHTFFTTTSPHNPEPSPASLKNIISSSHCEVSLYSGPSNNETSSVAIPTSIKAADSQPTLQNNTTPRPDDDLSELLLALNKYISTHKHSPKPMFFDTYHLPYPNDTTSLRAATKLLEGLQNKTPISLSKAELDVALNPLSSLGMIIRLYLDKNLKPLQEIILTNKLIVAKNIEIFRLTSGRHY